MIFPIHGVEHPNLPARLCIFTPTLSHFPVTTCAYLYHTAPHRTAQYCISDLISRKEEILLVDMVAATHWCHSSATDWIMSEARRESIYYHTYHSQRVNTSHTMTIPSLRFQIAACIFQTFFFFERFSWYIYCVMDGWVGWINYR